MKLFSSLSDTVITIFISLYLGRRTYIVHISRNLITFVFQQIIRYFDCFYFLGYTSNYLLDTVCALILFLLSVYPGSSHLKPDTMNLKTVTKSTRRFMYFLPVIFRGFRVCSIDYVRAAHVFMHTTLETM